MTQQSHFWKYILRILKHQSERIYATPPTMFIAAIFITMPSSRDRPKCPSVGEWIKKLWYIYTMEYYTAERKKEFLPLMTTWMELEIIMLSAISQVMKDK